MLTPNPAEAVTGLALRTFAPDGSILGLLPVAILGFLLPLRAAPMLSSGMTGWIRHLSYSSEANKRGLLLALATSQVPLWISLLVIGIVAYVHGCKIWHAMPYLILLLMAGTYIAIPVHRRNLTVLLAVSAAACAFSRSMGVCAVGFLLLTAADCFSGVIRQMPGRKPWRTAESLFDWRIAWRALGFALARQYALSLLIVGVMAMFAGNSELKGSLLAATSRFAGVMVTGLFASTVAARLAEKRPPWPWARSFPVSSYQRVASDTIFLGLHAAPLLIPIALIEVSSIWYVLATLPLIAIRAAGQMRRIRQQRTEIRENLLWNFGRFGECFLIAGLLALLPWTVVIWICMSVAAFISARNADTRQKVSLWLELHYMAAGDPLNWSDR